MVRGSRHPPLVVLVEAWGLEGESHIADAGGVTFTGTGGLGRAHGATATETCLVAPMMAISKSGRSKPVTAPPC